MEDFKEIYYKQCPFCNQFMLRKNTSKESFKFFCNCDYLYHYYNDSERQFGGYSCLYKGYIIYTYSYETDIRKNDFSAKLNFVLSIDDIISENFLTYLLFV